MTDYEDDETPAQVPEDERPPVPLLRWLVDTYAQAQKLRIQIGNRIGAMEREADQGPPPASAGLMYERLGEAEAALQKDMADALDGHPAMRWLSEVRGVGPILAAKLLAFIDINRAQTPSALWRFAGYAVIDGKRERPVKGQKLTYNIRLKTTCYLVATSFLRSNSPYRDIYDTSRTYYAENRPDWTKAHCHLAAMRRMTKLFLAHLWITWREAEGLPVRAPYAMEYQGHTTYHDPWQFVGKRKKDAA